MEINYIAVLVCAVLSLVIGSVWYGPIFGRKWMEICKVTDMDIEKRKEMQRKAMPLYVTQLLLSIVQIWVLAFMIISVKTTTGLGVSLLIWLGFIMPTVAGAAMWNNDTSKVKWARFLIQSGCQLVTSVVIALILVAWK
jgi:hypothetical protein